METGPNGKGWTKSYEIYRRGIIIFTAITKGPVPFGVFLKFPKGRKGEKVGEETVLSLQKKGILDQERTFTKQGQLPVMLWEAYRNCSCFLLMNKVMIGLGEQGKRQAILLTRTGTEYEFVPLDVTAVLK